MLNKITVEQINEIKRNLNNLNEEVIAVAFD